MVIHTCPNCNKEFTKKSTYNDHVKNKKKPCVINEKNPVDSLTNPADSLTNPADSLTNPTDFLTNPVKNITKL